MHLSRGAVYARSGIAATSHPLATSAALAILRHGGNCVDAAIAASAVLCVVQPWASHLGGDGFALLFDASAGAVTAYNGSGASPTGHPKVAAIPERGPLSVTVPGLPHLWGELHRHHGRRELRVLLQAAIDYASDGFPASRRWEEAVTANRELLSACPAAAKAFLPTGRPARAGHLVRQPDLARTLDIIAANGTGVFYHGDVAERIADHFRSTGGTLALKDLKAHATEVGEPIRTDYRGWTVHGQPPVSQGCILLEELNIMEGFDPAVLRSGTGDLIHLQVEAKKLAFTDRLAHLGDPSLVPDRTSTLLSKEWASERRGLISSHKASEYTAGALDDHDTTYFCVADRQGNAISFIQSVYFGFGSGVVAEGAGILFNNRMNGFTLEAGHPNEMRPGKRPMHTLNTFLITHGDRLAFVGGTPGGDVQVQTNLQIIMNLLDFGMNPQEAIEQPRWSHGGSLPTEPTGVLNLEERFGAGVVPSLAAKGHRVAALTPWGHGSAAQLIQALDSGAYVAGSDPRAEGHAAGF